MTAFHIEPIHSSPSWNWHSVPEMRGAAVLADRGHRLVLVGVEALLHALGERGSGGGELGPGSHGREGGAWRRSASSRRSKTINMWVVADRLRELIDGRLASLDEPVERGVAGVGVRTSRAITWTGCWPRRRASRRWRCGGGCCSSGRRGSCAPGRLRRRRRRRLPGYGSVAAFSRAFARAYGAPPSAFDGEIELRGAERHPLPPAGGVAAAGRARASSSDLTERMVRHHLDRVRELLACGGDAVAAGGLARPVRPGFVAVWFEGEEASAALMCERLVFTLEVWVAAMAGEPVPEGGGAWSAAVRAGGARRSSASRSAIRDRGAFDDAFVDALCEPPQSFTYGGVLSHVLSYGAIRREALASVLASSWAPRCRRSAIRSCGRRLRARGSGWPGTRRCPEGRRAPAGRCSRERRRLPT